MFRRLALLFLVAALHTPSANAAAIHRTLLATYKPPLPAPAGAVFASNARCGSVGVGNDTTGDGSRGKPYQTVDKAYTSVSAGGVIVLNGCTASPSTYRHATFLSITKSVTLQPLYAYGARLAASTATATRVVNLNVSGGSVAFGRLIIDAENYYSSVVSMSDTASLMNVAFNGTKLLNWVTQGAYSAGSATKIAANYNGAILQAGNARSGIYHTGLTTGSSVTVSGGNVTITQQNLSGHGGVILESSASGVSAAVRGLSVDLNLLSSLTGAGTHYAAQIQNIANAEIGWSRGRVVGPYGSRQAEVFQCTASSDGNARDSSGCWQHDNYGYNDTTGGMIFEVGTDGQTTPPNNLVGGAIVERNVAQGTANSAGGSVHAFFAGNKGNAIVRNNRADTVGLCYGDKEGVGAQFLDNSCNNPYLYGVVSKGATNGYYARTTITGQATGGVVMLRVEANPTTGVNATGAVFEDTQITMNGKAGMVPVSVIAGSDATFRRGVYTLASGSLAANPFQYTGTNYTTFAAWKAAHEPDATANFP